MSGKNSKEQEENLNGHNVYYSRDEGKENEGGNKSLVLAEMDSDGNIGEGAVGDLNNQREMRDGEGGGMRDEGKGEIVVMIELQS